MHIVNMACIALKKLASRSPCKYCEKFHRSYNEWRLQQIRRMSKQSVRKSEWRSVVGLEIHAQINTASKLFSGASTKYGSLINSQVALFDAALPGTLPVLNKECVEAGVLTALALGCKISPVSKFDRKHYFYADLPAGYQITQQRQPLARDGEVQYVHAQTAAAGEKPAVELRSCRLVQLQLEQDSGKSIHDPHDSQSLIDLNRAGMGLMEVVTHPDLRDGEDAASFVKELRLLLKTIGTCDGRMQEGSMRVDANISIHRPGEPLGVRTEVKNINSIRNVSKAIDFEIQRHIAVLESGRQVENETRSFDGDTNETVPMRDKEKLLDYRFMPEPNLPPLHVYQSGAVPHGVEKDQAIVLGDLEQRLPPLPSQIRQSLQEKYNIPPLSANLLVMEEGLREILESLLTDQSRDATSVLDVLLYNLKRVLEERDCSAAECPIPMSSLGEVCDLFGSGEISSETVRELLLLLFDQPGMNIAEVVDRENWRQFRDRELIAQLVNDILATQPKVRKRFKKGRGRAVSAVMGPLEKKLDRRVDFLVVREVVDDILSKLPQSS